MSADKPFTGENLDTRCRKIQEPLLKLFTKKKIYTNFISNVESWNRRTGRRWLYFEKIIQGYLMVITLRIF